MKLLYIYNSGRPQKILSLLGDIDVLVINSFWELKDYKRFQGADGVLIDSFGSYAVRGLLASFLLRIPLLVRLKGEFFREEKERWFARGRLFYAPKYIMNVIVAWLCLRHASLILCNSNYIRKSSLELFPQSRMAVVYNPYLPVKDRNESEMRSIYRCAGLRLLTVTNMNLSSKVEPLLEVIENIPLAVWNELDLQWIICGKGIHYDRLKRSVENAGLQERVHLVGYLNHIGSAYAECDVLVHLTRMDAFPNVIIEAMMYKKPVIINADSCGAREQVFDNENGFVCSDIDEFISALKSYFIDPDLRARHGSVGRAFVCREFTVEEQSKRMLKALKSLKGTI